MRRRRRLNRAKVATAIVSVALLVNGCEARVFGTPPAAENTPQAPVVAPQASLPALPEAPPNQPTEPLAGLDARVRQATADAAASGADIETVVLDRNTGLSFAKIATALEAEGILSPAGRPTWQPSTVRRIYASATAATELGVTA